MKLFSEKVNSTFTNSSFNVLQVENFSEIFFDVYEIELNKIKYPAEKIDEHDGHPVVSVPVVIGEQEYKYPFVLLKGPFEVLFNEKNNSISEISEAPELIEESIEEVEDVIEPTNFEIRSNYDDLFRENSKKEILNQIKIAKQQAATKIKKLKETALSEAAFDIKIKKKEFDKTLQDAKDTLVNEFVQISNNIKSELLDTNNDRYSEIKDTVSAKIGLLAENLQSNITEDFQSASKSFDSNIRALVMELHTSSVLPKLKDELTVIASDVVEKVSKIEESLNDKLSNKVDVSMLEGVNNEINAIQIANVELNNNINKGVNKALSRLGNVNNKIDDAIVDLSESVDIKIKSATDNITNYYSSKIKELEDQTFEINESSRKYFIDLIQESKNNLIQEIRNIKKDAPIEYVIESNTGRTSKSFDSITSELDKKISDKISDEVIRLRKYISLYSGGGTVAQQFAAGGIMNGNLTVTGSISASNYLGLVIPNPDLTKYLPISGGTITGDLTVKNTLSAYSLSADRIFVSQLDALSANITVIDIKQYELSGFNVTGDCTIQGSVSSNNAIYGTNLVYTSTLTALSSNWNSTFNTVSSLSSNWQTAYTTLSTKANLTGANLFSGTQTVSGILSSNNAVYGNNLVYLNGNTTGSNVTIGTNDSYNLALETNGVNRMTILSSGNVGLGTSSPAQLLHVNGDGARIRIQSTNAFSNPVLELVGPSFTNFLFAGSDGAWNIRTDSATRPVYIQSIGNQAGSIAQGNVQIGGISGVSAPNSQLVVRSNFNNLTGNLLELQNFSGTTVMRVSNTGSLSTSSNITASNYNPGPNVAEFLQTPTSDNLRAALTDDTGTGANVFANNPILASPAINTALTLNATTYTYGVSAKESLRLSQGVANSWVNKDGLIPIVQLFEDFPQGISGGSYNIGTHGWVPTRTTGGANNFYNAAAGSTQLAWGIQSLTTAALSSAYSGLQLGPYNGQCGNPIGSSMQICFAVPASSTSQSTVYMQYAGGGGAFITYLDFAASKFYFSYINSSSVYVNTDLATGLTLSAGDFVSGKRYRMYMRLITSTSSEFYLASADWNSSTWTTIYDNIVTHAAPSHRDTQTTPIFGISTLDAVSKTMYVDWVALEFNRQR
jgi:hypothetical protein